MRTPLRIRRRTVVLFRDLTISAAVVDGIAARYVPIPHLFEGLLSLMARLVPGDGMSLVRNILQANLTRVQPCLPPGVISDGA